MTEIQPERRIDRLAPQIIETVMRPMDAEMMSMTILFLKTYLFTPDQAAHLSVILKAQTRRSK